MMVISFLDSSNNFSLYRVLPEYCRSIDEAEVMDNVFQLIFAFDEIVALGYRENVNLAQIQTFTKMDSHEEKVRHNTFATLLWTSEFDTKIFFV